MNRGSAKRRPRVAEVVTRMDVGGVPDHVMSLVRHLCADFDVTVICGSIDPRHADELAALGVPVELVAFERTLSPWADLRTFAALARLYRARGFDLVHTHMSKAALVGALAAKFARVPVVVNTAHNLGFIALQKPLPRFVFRVYDTVLFRLTADAVLTVSDLVRERIVQSGMLPAERVVAVHNGVDIDRLRAAPADIAARRAEFGVRDTDVLIVSVARLVWFKGLDSLVTAMPEISARCPNARVLLVGEGPLRADLHDLSVRLGVSERIQFAGERVDVAALLGAADLFVLPSVSEGLPISILEAMAVGRAVVATSVGGVPELVEDGVTGLLVAPRDPVGLAAAVSRLTGDPDLRRAMGERGRARVEAEFSASRMARRISEVFHSLWNQKARGALDGRERRRLLSKS